VEVLNCQDCSTADCGGYTSMFNFLKNVSKEMKKVSWPTGKELTNYTITVIATVAFVAVFFGVVDMIISYGIDLL